MATEIDLSGLVLPETVEEMERSHAERRAEFVLQPLERGFGHTIGNSIRRILLSSLPGAAVWAFRADGVQHEHQTIEGVAEDVHQIIQNLKRLVLIMDPEVDEAQLELAVHEAGPIRASEIADHPAVTVVNPDLLLFTLQEDQPENRPLRVDLWVNRGRGFVMAEDHEVPDGMPVDAIPVDSLYNPVVNANFRVRETRVGERTDFDRLAISVETNGAMDPADALGHAAGIARTHLDYLSRFGEPVGVPGRRAEDGKEPAELPRRRPLTRELQELLDRSLDSFEEISVRSRNTLEKAEIRTLADVARRTRDEILNVPNFGEKSLEELAEVMAANKLHFGMSLERGEDGHLYVREDGAGANGASENGAGGEDDESGGSDPGSGE